MTPINHLLAEVDRAWSNAVSIVWNSELDHQLKVYVVADMERTRVAQLDRLQRLLITIISDDERVDFHEGWLVCPCGARVYAILADYETYPCPKCHSLLSIAQHIVK